MKTSIILTFIIGIVLMCGTGLYAMAATYSTTNPTDSTEINVNFDNSSFSHKFEFNGTCKGFIQADYQKNHWIQRKASTKTENSSGTASGDGSMIAHAYISNGSRTKESTSSSVNPKVVARVSTTASYSAIYAIPTQTYHSGEISATNLNFDLEIYCD